MYCPNCGQENPDNEVICQRCGKTLSKEPTNIEAEKVEKIPNGALGALIGALIGGACILLLNQLGYVASISGIVLAFCTLKGYELLGGKLSATGMVISSILILIMPFCAYILSTGIALCNEWQAYMPGITVAESIELMFELVETEPEMQDALVQDLLQLYLFTGLGVVAYLVSKKKTKK